MKVLQVVGYKNAGKTTLVSEIVRFLSAKGMKIGTIKHDAHDHGADTPGSDSWRHREAGAKATALVSDSRTMWIRENRTSLPELVAAMDAEGMDAVIVEGFKTAAFPKLLLLQGDQDAELLSLPGVIAVVLRHETEGSSPDPASMANYPIFHTGGLSFGSVLDFIERWLCYNDGQEKKSEVH
jgi:molybdopterin-guanine dinucleotide biosynthesis protein B